MKNYIEVTEKLSKFVSITCDKCHKEYSNVLQTQEFLSIDFIGGYSSVFGDMIQVECDICQYCLKDMIIDICRKTDRL